MPAIRKVLSAGRMGAERAALDVAEELAIAVGGRLPTDGGIGGDGTPSAESDGADWIERNVAASDGTLIITSGRPIEDADAARRMALQYRKQLLHIDVSRVELSDAASLARSWIDIYRIQVLNVVGRFPDDPTRLYAAALHILMMALNPVGPVSAGVHGAVPLPETEAPQTLEDAVCRLLVEMPLKEKASLAKLSAQDLSRIHPSLSEFIITRFGLNTGNRALVESCRFVAKEKEMDAPRAAAVIIRALWKRIRKTHAIRLVK